ncbi:MAG: Fic family protein [Deltaproteobacteria bacterium]|nr:Fic family protein [Deltaproteobacteria bacterium]
MPHYIWQRPNWTSFRWNADVVLPIISECRMRQGKLLCRVSSLGITLEQQAQAEIAVEETVKTAAIEGENLSRESVRSSVARRLGLPSAGLPVDRHIDGLVSVLLDATRNFDAPLTVKRVHGWHAALFPTGYSGLHKIRVGKRRGAESMRVVSGPVGKEKIHFEAPPSNRIEKEIRHFLAWWEKERGKTEGLLRAAIAHFWFVTIHPYEDGNGRLARAITDMAIAQDDGQPLRYYSLSAQIMAERDAYYNALERCSKGEGDITEWLSWFFACFSRATERSEKILSIVFDKAGFWNKHAGTPLSERQKKVANRLLDAGRDGFEGGLTTRKYVSMAKVSRATAFREIEQLLQSGILRRRPGGGRGQTLKPW